MAHTVYYYLRQHVEPGVGIGEVERALADIGRTPTNQTHIHHDDAVTHAQGANWSSVAVEWASAWTGVEIHSEPTMWADLSSAGPLALDPADIYGMVILTLSGRGLDEPVLTRLRSLFIEEWGAVEYDEIGGFTTG